MLKPLTEEEQHQAEVDVDLLVLRAVEIINAHKPADMDTEKIIQRMGMFAAIAPCTRTNTLAALVYVAVHAPVVGLTALDMVAVLHEVYKMVEELPSTPRAARDYEEHNKESKSKVFEGFLAQGSDKVH